MLRNYTNNLLVNACKNNATNTRNIFYVTEYEQYLINYLKQYDKAAIIKYNYNKDSLNCALLALNNYSPFQYGEELKLGLSINLNLVSDCVGDSVYTIPTAFNIYGSNRLGTMDAKLSRKVGDNSYKRSLGTKTYELTNHLGNVMATVSDKKLHPQEYDGINIGYKADITGQYDYYPFGMEIASRSGDFGLVDYTKDEYVPVYDGLLNYCSDYDIINQLTFDCETATNLYNESYVSSLTVTGVEQEEFKVDIHMRLSEIIPNLDPNGVYVFNIMIDQSQGRHITATMDTATAVVMSPSLGGDGTQMQVQMASDKVLTVVYTGAGLLASAQNGKVELEITAHSDPEGENRSIVVTNIHIDELRANMSLPIAMRVGAGYRYGFNGMERDDEVKGSGNSYDFGARIYDSRLGRWMSLDPLQAKYAGWSPYNFTMDNPIFYIDPDGKDSRVSITQNKNGGGTITITTVAHVYGMNAKAVAEYANNLIENLNTTSTVKIDGQTWNVNFNIEFKVNQDLKSLDPNSQGLSYNDAKGVEGVQKGDNFVCTDCPLSIGALEEADFGGSRTKSPGRTSAVHGVFHNLGFDDAYSIVGDVMSRSTKPSKIDQSHYENVAKKIVQLITPKLENGVEYPAQIKTYPKTKEGDYVIQGETFE